MPYRQYFSHITAEKDKIYRVLLSIVSQAQLLLVQIKVFFCATCARVGIECKSFYILVLISFCIRGNFHVRLYQLIDEIRLTYFCLFSEVCDMYTICEIRTILLSSINYSQYKCGLPP